MKKAKPKRRRLLTTDMSHLERQRMVKHEGKRVYHSMTEAREHAKNFRKRYGPKTMPYVCKYDEKGQGVHYHIGHYRNVKRRSKIRDSLVEYKEDE